jgi:hypothetical protein
MWGWLTAFEDGGQLSFIGVLALAGLYWRGIFVAAKIAEWRDRRKRERAQR